MTSLCKIEPCLNIVFEFIDLKQLHQLFFSLLNHELKDKIQSQIHYIKRNNIIYLKLLKDKISYDFIEHIPVVFFEMNTFISKNNNFKKYIFNLFIELNPENNMFYLANRRYELYFVKKLDHNTIIMIHNVNKDMSIYFSIFEYKIDINNENKYGKNYCGFLIYNNVKIMENLHIMNYIL